MPSYNTKFDLDLNDLEMIENALRAAAGPEADGAICAREANELLGRLHNQKVFYRPSKGQYVSG